MKTASASGKVILFGEHAVVYGRPALAVPLSEMRARAGVETREDGRVVVNARDLEREIEVVEGVHDPLATIVRVTLDKLGKRAGIEIAVDSDIPMASGFGSGAAISTAIVRAVAGFFEVELSRAEIAELVYETEKEYHGTPSGIDNSVIAYESAIRFVRRTASTSGDSMSGGGAEVTPFPIARPFHLVIANTGIASPTKITVGDVRRGWQENPARYDALFDTIRGIVQEAEDALASGENERLGDLMDRNQLALIELGVSSSEIEWLLDAGRSAGAGGGKLSGGGRGGNVIFYAPESKAAKMKEALLEAGAVSVIVTKVGGGVVED